MSDINLHLVREYFELNQFRVSTMWRQEGPGAQLLVENAQLLESVPSPFLLTSVRGIAQAYVEIRAWHTDRMYPSVIESNPILTAFAKPGASDRAAGALGSDRFSKILVISEFPHAPEVQAESIALFEAAGIDHVIEFPTMLRDLLSTISPHENYSASVTLQLLQFMKRYRLLRNDQMEFQFPLEAPGAAEGSAEVDTE